jgi:DNA processing protein
VDRDRHDWIALNMVPGVGSVAFRQLLGVFGGPRAVFKATPKQLAAVPGIGPSLIEAIRSFPLEKRLNEELKQMEKYGVSVVTCLDTIYPKALLAIYDPPPLLYVRGELATRDDVAIAIVGSRMATHHGLSFTEQLARDLAVHGITVVSGMARGIDSAAHRGALLGRGRTIAVLGCGVDVVYPRESRGLMKQIVETGAVISEFPMGTKPLSGNFPRRNRIISGLAAGVVVVEATRQSGSLITANYALDQGREVFAVPGNVRSPGSQGTNHLIKQGAKLVAEAQDVLEEILPQLNRQHGTMRMAEDRPQPVLTEEEQVVLSLLSTEPVHIDHLISETRWDAGRVLRILLNLELTGLVNQLAGKQFVRVS